MRFPGIGSALLMALPATAAAGGIEIRHDPVRCVSAGRYARITAAGAPAEDVVRAELQFRVRSGSEWYSVLMAPEADAWSATLPRPNQALAQFEYRIVMTATDLAPAETAPFAVRVGDDCDGTQSSVAVEAPIVVRVPASAPAVPPVPQGFSPAGVTAAEAPEPKASATKKWVALAGVAGGVAAAAVAASSAAQSQPLPSGVPDFEFFGASPNPGSVLSLSRDRLSVNVRVTGARRFSLDLLWRIDLLGAGESACAVMFGTRGINALRPQVVDLTSRPVPSGSCGTRFDVQTARLTIMVEGQVVYDQTHVLPYHFEP